MKSFQTILIVIFVIGAILAVIIFGKGNKTGSSGEAVTINVWGTIPQNYFQPSIDEFTKTNSETTVIYTYLPEEGLYPALIEALASGFGPDVFILSDGLAYQLKDKIKPFPFETLSVENFKTMFLSSADVFLYSGGVLAIPITVDPLVLYYNQDILQAGTVAFAPKTWKELLTMVPQFNKFDSDGNITQSAIAMGEHANINNFREILTALSFQGGTKITGPGEKNRLLTSSELSKSSGMVGAMTFFSQFSDIKSEYYSWNLSFGSDRDEFLKGNVAFYVGYSSELFEMRDLNPNINFDVAKLPQLNPDNPSQVKNYAKVLGVAVSRNSVNQIPAYQFAAQFANPTVSQKILSEMNKNKYTVASPLRILSNTKDSANPYVSVMYQSAIISDSFVDPNYNKTTEFFKNMISAVNSGMSSPADAVNGFFTSLKSQINAGSY